MSQNPLSAKLAATAAQSMEDKAAAEAASTVQAPVQQTELQTGAQTVGANIAGAHNAQGRAVTDMRAPGYYSIHVGRIYLKGRAIDWPMHSPIVPEEDDEELISYLKHLVKCNRAVYVKEPSK